MIKVSMEMNIAGKKIWQIPRKGEKLTAAKEEKKGSVRNRSICCCVDVVKEKKTETRCCRSYPMAEKWKQSFCLLCPNSLLFQVEDWKLCLKQSWLKMKNIATF